jgi:hypothetical protein
MTTALDGVRTPRAVIVTGHQRTGTTAFRETVGRLRDFADCGEICTPLRARQQSEESFFTFLGLQTSNETRGAGYTDGECWQAMEHYVDYLGARHPRKTVLLDVKYDFLHNFNSTSWLFTAQPLLLEFARRKGYPVLHFTRANLLQVYCSVRYGRATGKWHYRDGETAPEETTIRVEPDACLAWLLAARAAVELVRGWLRDHPNGIELRYEDLFDDGRIATGYAARLGDLLNTSLHTDMAVSFTRTPVRYAHAVENLDDVATRLRSTDFAWMVEELQQA